jgi:uncharacterized protein
MTPVFLDTVGLLALWDEDDQWHEPAEAAFALIASKRAPAIVTSFVLLECGDAAARRPYREQVCVLREQLERVGAVVSPTGDDWTEAWDAYRQSVAGEAGIVDHVSFVVMRRLGIRQAFANGEHQQSLPGLLRTAEGRRPRHPDPSAGQGGIRQAAVSDEWRANGAGGTRLGTVSGPT